MVALRRAPLVGADLGMIIAVVAATRVCIVVTDNEKDFDGLRIFNPLREGAG